jgi:hypothetical protein
MGQHSNKLICGVKSMIFFQYTGQFQHPLPLRASPVVLYCKPESGKKWKDVNCGSDQQGKSLYSSFIYRLKPGFGRFFRFFRFCKWFLNVLLRKDTQVWENDIPMITGLQAYKTTGDAPRLDISFIFWENLTAYCYVSSVYWYFFAEWLIQ